MGQPATVFVVDPDASVRHSLESAIRRAGWTPEITASPRTPAAELAAFGVARVSWALYLYFASMAHFEDQLRSLQ